MQYSKQYLMMYVEFCERMVHMQEYKGRLTYAKGTYVEFVVAPDEDVDFGDILAIEGKNEDVFYIRVYDFKVKSRWSDLNGVGYLMSKLDGEGKAENQEELDFYLGGNHTVKIGMAEQLCYTNGEGQLFNPKTCPDFFCQVRALKREDTILLAELKGDLEIGLLKSGRAIMDLPVGIYGEKTIGEHIGVFGTTGSGKSNLVKVLAGSIATNGNYGVLIFDVHNEYDKALRQHPRAKEKIFIYHTGESDEYAQQLRFNYAELSAEAIVSCASFTEPQLDALFKLSAVWQDKWLEYILTYDVVDIIEALKEETGQKFQSRTISKIKSICWNLKQELNISNHEESCLTEIINKLETGNIVLIEMKELSTLGEYALSTLLSQYLLHHYTQKTEAERQNLKTVLIVLEEAHRFLGKKEHTTNNIFAQLVSEARKFNLGMCIIDQQPRLLADQVLSQLNTLFILGLASKADRNKLESMSRKDILKQRNEIKNLDCGEMIAATNYMRFAAPVKVYKYEDYLERLSS